MHKIWKRQKLQKDITLFALADTNPTAMATFNRIHIWNRYAL